MKEMTKRLTVLGFLALLLILSDRVVGLGFVRNPVQRAVRPIEYGLSRLGLTLFRGIRFIGRVPVVYQENRRLHIELNDYFATLVENESLRKENQALRQQLRVQGVREHLLILARVLGVDAQLGMGRLVVDRGEQDGVAENNIAVVEGFLIGRVVQVQKHQSVIETIFGHESRVAVEVNNAEALLRGEFGQKLVLEEIPLDAQITRGELILTTGASGIYPPNLIVGRVVEVIEDDQQPYLTAEVEPFWQIGEIGVVFLQP